MSEIKTNKISSLTSSNSDITLDPDGTGNLIVSSGNVGIGTSSPAVDGVEIKGDGTRLQVSSADYDVALMGRRGSSGADLDKGYLRLRDTGTTKVVLDSAGDSYFNGGNVGIGTTTLSSEFTLAGRADITNAGLTQILDRTSSVGDLALFRYNGSSVGSIGARSAGNLFVSFRPESVGDGCGLTGSGSSSGAILATDGDGNTIDDHIDLGVGSVRFDDIFATNGTIQTSDQNEKEQISSLTTAEITAAKAISKLFKTFKWQDKVAAKGDAARTHAGVIAQEVRTAMTDAGLDATDYAFWCSNTWWESDETYTDDNGVEKTRTNTYDTADEAPEGATQRIRLGIRYPELLAFIGAATEQRLADLEARVTALENA